MAEHRRGRLLVAMTAVGILTALAGACSSSAPSGVAAPETTTWTVPPRPSTTIPPEATDAELSTMAPVRAQGNTDSFWWAQASVTRCSEGSVGCQVGEQEEIPLALGCLGEGCTVWEPLAPSTDAPSASLTNDGTGTWSGTYPLASRPFLCDDVPVPSRSTVTLHVVSAQWLPYERRFEPTRLAGQIEQHGDAGGGCGSITVDYDFFATVK